MLNLKKQLAIAIMILASFSLLGQNGGEIREVKFDRITVNQTVVEPNNKKIVIGNSDSLTIRYGVELPENARRSNFLFRIKLKRGDSERSTSTGSPVTSYKNLDDGIYEFTVDAFDLEGTWKTNTDTLIIEVDNSEASLAKKLIAVENEIAKKDSIIQFAKNNATQDDNSLLTKKNIIIALIALIIGILIAILLVRILSKSNKRSKKMPEKNQEISNSQNDLKEENSRLKAELAALRGQISAMQLRGEEIQKQNNELKQHIEKLDRSKQELEDLQTQKDELFAVVIHDIKNPVSLIKSLVELLGSYDLTASEQQEVMEDLTKTTLKIVSLSQEVSKIMTLEGNKLKLNIEKVDIKNVIDDVFHRNKANADKKLIKMTNEIPEDLPDIELDPYKIDEVTDNLLSNAIKFTQEGGSVKIKGEKDEKGITIQIIDNGLGLSESDIRRAFQRGSKLSARPTAGESSSGLGLWIVKKLIEAHGGRVWVRSTLGKGSTFAYWLPFEKYRNVENN